MSRKRAEYVPVILEVGSRFIRAGFAGKREPTIIRCTSAEFPCNAEMEMAMYPSFFGFNDKAMTTEERDKLIEKATKADPDITTVAGIYSRDIHKVLRMGRNGAVNSSVSKFDEVTLLNALYEIFDTHLMISPRKCKVVLIDSNFPISYKFTLTDVLINVLKVRSVVFEPTAILAMIGAGKRDGLVIDIGWEALTIEPIIDLRILSGRSRDCCFFDDFNGSTLHYRLVEKLIKLNDDKVTEVLQRADLFEIIETFVMQHAFVKETPQSLEEDNGVFELVEGIQVPNKLRYEIFEEMFFSNEKFYDSISQAIASNSNIDSKALLYGCIVFTGGVSCIPGFKSRLFNEMKSRFGERFGSPKTLGPWAGCSLYVSSVLIRQEKAVWKEQEITREKLGLLTSDSLESVYRLSGLPDFANERIVY